LAISFPKNVVTCKEMRGEQENDGTEGENEREERVGQMPQSQLPEERQRGHYTLQYVPTYVGGRGGGGKMRHIGLKKSHKCFFISKFQNGTEQFHRNLICNLVLN